MNTTQWIPPNRGIEQWATDWLHGFRGTSPRTCLVHQLLYIRSAHGIYHATQFAKYLRRIGEYPAKR